MEIEILQYFLINFVNNFRFFKNFGEIIRPKGYFKYASDNCVLLGVLWITLLELLISVGTKSKKMEHPVVVQEEGSTPSR